MCIRDRRIHRLQADSLAAVRQAARMQADSLNRTMEEVPPLQAVAPADSIATADSIAAENKKKLLEITSAPVLKESEVPADSLKKEIDHRKPELAHRILLKARKYGVQVQSTTICEWAKKWKNSKTD